MMAFVKNIKEDINETKIFTDEDKSTSHEEARKNLIKTISKKLDTYKSKSPTLIDPEADIDKLKVEFEKATTKFVDNIFTLNNEIEDIATGDAFPKSSLLKQSDFPMIKKWLEKEFANKKWKLVFKGTKDGMNATAFHNNANNKGPTITVVKSTHGKIFGGFAPESWTSRNNYINSQKTFIFSVTNKAKHELISPSSHCATSCYDYSSYGPTFGGGHDFHLSNDFTSNSNYCNKNSFNFTDNNALTGGYNFQCEEVEVYSLDKK